MGVTSAQGFIVKLIANGEQLDLFKDEEIKLSNNVTGLFDLGVMPADFTRQLTIPGTKKNNAFFEHVYDISVDSPDTWATNVKVDAYLDFGGMYISNGYLQLNKVSVIANKFIDSYEVTLYGAISSFARDVNRNFLTDLTSSLAQYNHTSSYEIISGSWNGELFGGDIVYPMAEYGQKITFQPGNVFFGINANESGMCVQDYKPAIRVKKVWDAIFDTYGYTYSGSFWEQGWLDNVYMLCDNRLKYPIYQEANLETYGLMKIGPVTGSADNEMTAGTPLLLPWYNTLSNPNGNMSDNLVYHLDYPTALRGVINLNVKTINTANAAGYPYFYIIAKNYDTGATTSLTTLVKINGYFTELGRQWASQGLKTPTETFEASQEFNTSLLPAGNYRFYLEYNRAAFVSFDLVLDPDPNLKSYLEITKCSQLGNGWVMNMGNNMPFGTVGIKQIDFIKGLQKKFNLVMYPSKTKPREFIVETFNNWYNKGEIKNFNKYINLDDKIEVIPANNFAVNELNFGDTLDGDYISQQFAKGANREYGKQYYVDTNNYFSQGKFEVKTTFASSPIIYLSGTGVSGSATGNVVATPVNGDGLVQLSSYSSPYDVCSNYLSPQRIVYSSTGLIEEGAVLYFDAYGNDKVVGYTYVVDNGDGSGCYIWNLDPITGIVATRTTMRCSMFGGCV
jgi:hypothetical protein